MELRQMEDHSNWQKNVSNLPQLSQKTKCSFFYSLPVLAIHHLIHTCHQVFIPVSQHLALKSQCPQAIQGKKKYGIKIISIFRNNSLFVSCAYPAVSFFSGSLLSFTNPFLVKFHYSMPCQIRDTDVNHKVRWFWVIY